MLLAAHRFLAGAPSALMMLQIEDALGEVEQANLPGTVDQHPNWRRKLPLGLDELAEHPMLRRAGATRWTRPAAAPGGGDDRALDADRAARDLPAAVP